MKIQPHCLYFLLCDSFAFFKKYKKKSFKPQRESSKMWAIFPLLPNNRNKLYKARIVHTISYEKLLVYGMAIAKNTSEHVSIKEEKKKVLNVVNECVQQ